jgi:predicted dehydrogenase
MAGFTITIQIEKPLAPNEDEANALVRHALENPKGAHARVTVVWDGRNYDWIDQKLVRKPE